MSMIIDGTNGLTFNNATTQASAGQILQVVSTIKTDTFSMASTSWTSITGLSATITPKFSTSKILVQYYVCFNMSDSAANRGCGFKVIRNSTEIGVANAAGSRSQQGSFCISSIQNEGCNVASQIFSDSPASTSSLTYQLQMLFSSGSSFTGYINRSGRFLDNSENSQGPWTSGITVMEIAS
jgi:hypothetical protein